MRFLRTDITDGAEEILTIVETKTPFFCSALERKTHYLVQVTQDDDFAGIFDLDGDAIFQNLDWAIADDIPPDVVEAVEEGWATGNYTVEELA
jgi:hypothetical protein